MGMLLKFKCYNIPVQKELQSFFYFYVPVFSQKHIWIILSIVIRTL